MASGRDSSKVPGGPAGRSSPRAAPGGRRATAPPAGKLDPGALTVEQAAKILAAVGGRHATADVIRRHIDRGAPTTADGRINLVHYTAWLVREMAGGEE